MGYSSEPLFKVFLSFFCDLVDPSASTSGRHPLRRDKLSFLQLVEKRIEGPSSNPGPGSKSQLAHDFIPVPRTIV